MKRPLVAFVSCYTFGLLLGNFFQPPLVALFFVSLFVLFLALLRARFRPFLIWPLLALAGWTNLASRTAIVSPDDLRALLGNHATIIAVRGTLAETPSSKIFMRDEEQVRRTLARVRVNELKRNGSADWQPAFGTIVVTTPGVLPGNYFGGQPAQISGVIAPPDGPRAEGLFDYRDHLKKLGIFYTLKTDGANDWKLGRAASSNSPLSDRFIGWAKQTLTFGLDPQDESTQLLLAMTLGQKTVLSDEVSEPFMRSGTMHIFAISGLHIALIAGILLGLLRVIQLPRAVCGLIVLPLIWFYTAATGWQPSAIRSTIMMTVVIGGWMLNRPGNLLNSLAAAAFIILLWDPRQLFQASFQLSFFVVLSIALIAPPLNQFRDRLLQNDPLLPASLVPRWRRWAEVPLRWATACLTTSLAAWAGSLPSDCILFPPVQPRYAAGKRHRCAIGRVRVDGGTGQRDLRNVVPMGNGIVQQRSVVFHALHCRDKPSAHKVSRRVFIRPRAVLGHDSDLLHGHHRRDDRLAVRAPSADFERGGVDVNRRVLPVALERIAR